MLKFLKKLVATRNPIEPSGRIAPSAGSPPSVYTEQVPSKAQRDQDQILLFLVDLVDELDALPPSSSGGREELAMVRSRIADRLLLSDAEMVRDQTWNPERQRAVSVSEKALAQGKPRIGCSRVSGLCVAGRIVRKQEVVLEPS